MRDQTSSRFIVLRDRASDASFDPGLSPAIHLTFARRSRLAMGGRAPLIRFRLRGQARRAPNSVRSGQDPRIRNSFFMELEVRRLVGKEREATARLIAALAELDARRLYLAEWCSSLFTYCTQILHLSEHAAYGRIEAARAARKWPVIIELLAEARCT